MCVIIILDMCYCYPCHVYRSHLSVLVAFQLESTDGVTVVVYATTTAPLLAQLPADSGGYNVGVAVCYYSIIRGCVSVYGSSAYGTARALV